MDTLEILIAEFINRLEKACLRLVMVNLLLAFRNEHMAIYCADKYENVL